MAARLLRPAKPITRNSYYPQDFSHGVLDQRYWLPAGVMLLATAGMEWFYRRTI